MLKKQTINLEEKAIDENTLKSLARGDKYMLFKMRLKIDQSKINRCKLICKMFDEMPELEITNIQVLSANNDFINMLSEKPIFGSRDKFYEVIEFWSINAKDSTRYDYFTNMTMMKPSMKLSCKHAKSITINRLYTRDLNLDCTAYNLFLDNRIIPYLGRYSLGNQNFYDSIQKVQYTRTGSETIEDMHPEID